MSLNLVIAFLTVSVQLMAPILWVALGETICERAGILNVGIEGVMLIGAFTAALTGVYTGNVVLAIIFATAAGIVSGCLLAYLYVERRADQIVSGLIFNMFAFGITSALHERYLGGTVGPTLPHFDIPIISRIPFIGDIFFKNNVLVYLSLVAVPIVWYLLKRTRWGLNIRAVGERPDAAEAGGLNVWNLRFWATVFACALTAVGGASLVLGSSGGFIPNMTAGRGFIALGIVVVARWDPFLVLGVSLLFGFGQSLQFLAGQVSVLDPIPHNFWIALPYLITVLVVVLSPGSQYAAAVGIPYRRREVRRNPHIKHLKYCPSLPGKNGSIKIGDDQAILKEGENQ